MTGSCCYGDNYMYESTERKQEVGRADNCAGMIGRKEEEGAAGQVWRSLALAGCGQVRKKKVWRVQVEGRWKEGFRSEQGKRPPCPSFHSCSLLACSEPKSLSKVPSPFHPPSTLCVYRHQPISPSAHHLSTLPIPESLLSP